MSVGPAHHPNEDLLTDAAAGLLCSVTHLVVLTHCSFCPTCSEFMNALEMIGGALGSDALGDNDEMSEEWQGQYPELNLDRDPMLRDLLAPLLSMVLEALESRDWHELMPGLASLDLDGQSRGDQTEVSLVRFHPGVVGPWHTHNGAEAKVVLTGSLSDHRGTFNRGDIVISGPDIVHAPTAGPDEICYCLAITDAPALLVAPPEMTAADRPAV